MAPLPDHEHRELALNVSGSYIVQAPAGSGKTELLSLRYLSLLAICDEPEEVLAITFTRKAASEMKSRILESLVSAEQELTQADSNDALKVRRHQIASAALSRAAKRNWDILANPNRLKIQTIDSFCFNLASRIPLLSQLGGNPNLTDDVDRCFSAAIGATLATLNEETPLSDDIAMLLNHLDNDIGRAEKLLSKLLGNRDQWLSHVWNLHDANQVDRHYFQASLTELISESLYEVRSMLEDFEPEVVELLNHAARNLPESHRCRIGDYHPLSELPDTEPECLAYWRLLQTILLTQKNDWRRKIDKNSGFPASVAGDKEQTAVNKHKKEQWNALVEQLSPNEELRHALAFVNMLPEPALEDRQWEFLTAIARILRYLNAQLLLSFRHYKLVDHSQVAAAALRALGSEEEPTDLALALDHRISHILVDEFQDTSKLQTDLLRLLTAGWEPDDGRTLFLVGDAMQSVYGFRNANVGIYLNVREGGLGDIPLRALTLQSNFRSQSNIVDWVNQMFVNVFPRQPNPSRGAVPYTASIAQQPAIPDQGISVELISHEAGQRLPARQMEARRIAQRVRQLKQADSKESIAILVRNRSHLSSLIPELRIAGIQWQATDIDKLDSLPVIDDLQSLTRAILNLGDRIAWLAILRAPWCGLSKADLHTIALAAGEGSIWSAIRDYQTISNLSNDACERLVDVTRVLNYVLMLRGLRSLYQLVECAWTLLRGAAQVTDEVDQARIAHYLEMLREHQTGGSLRDYHEFADKVATAFIPSKAQQASMSTVHVMTMHKAKGLEFDHVLLPGLGAASRSQSKSLLEWHERVNHNGEPRLFIAALSPSGQDDDPLYKLLRFEQQRKSEYEDVRLLYIATTRARKSAHLTAVMERNKDGEAT
ncbi:MAG: UvrD-helicase domain-containing protein, partial [Gammaproteobacteria bacterium]|nr:UvrD-helicase domain-containing protein [Gammaproteobacteria bacterium]